MIPELRWWQHLYWSVRNGKWHAGWETKKQWPEKPYLGLSSAYYDGYHWCLHLGPFYLGAAYY